MSVLSLRLEPHTFQLIFSSLWLCLSLNWWWCSCFLWSSLQVSPLRICMLTSLQQLLSHHYTRYIFFSAFVYSFHMLFGRVLKENISNVGFILSEIFVIQLYLWLCSRNTAILITWRIKLQVSLSDRVQDMIRWLQQACKELSKTWTATEGSNYAEKYQVRQCTKTSKMF